MNDVVAYIGLGSNLDDPCRQVSTAIDELNALADCEVLARSSLYRSPPMGPPDQPDYINAVACVRTRLAAVALLDALQAIEQAHRRIRGERWGPRTLDLDILLYADRVIDEARLQVPHPGIDGRAFVLYPLAEIAADLAIPGRGPLPALLAACHAEGLEKLK